MVSEGSESVLGRSSVATPTSPHYQSGEHALSPVMLLASGWYSAFL